MTLFFISVSAGNGRWGRDRGVSGTDRWLSEWLDLYFYLNFVCMTCISSVSFCCYLKGKQKNHLDQIDNLSGLLCLKELGGTTIENVFLAISHVHYPLSVHSLTNPCLHTLFFKGFWSCSAMTHVTCCFVPWADWERSVYLYSTAVKSNQQIKTNFGCQLWCSCTVIAFISN